MQVKNTSPKMHISYDSSNSGKEDASIHQIVEKKMPVYPGWGAYVYLWRIRFDVWQTNTVFQV